LGVKEAVPSELLWNSDYFLATIGSRLKGKVILFKNILQLNLFFIMRLSFKKLPVIIVIGIF